jgi:hypothetical protein
MIKKKPNVIFSFASNTIHDLSGKTYTMSAMYEQAANEIFTILQKDSTGSESVDVSLSFVEISCDSSYDLLNGSSEVSLLAGGDGNFHAFPTVEPTVQTAEELVAMINHGRNVRATALTGVHDASSRSHAILKIFIRKRNTPPSSEVVSAGNSDSGASSEGVLTLVDLAGTEHKIDSMYHSAERRKEGAGINASLMALKECIRMRTGAAGEEKSGVSQGAHHYRKSKLTMALKQSLNAPGSRTVVIATVSPASKDTEHSLNTLRHACVMDGQQNSSGEERFITGGVMRAEQIGEIDLTALGKERRAKLKAGVLADPKVSNGNALDRKNVQEPELTEKEKSRRRKEAERKSMQQMAQPCRQILRRARKEGFEICQARQKERMKRCLPAVVMEEEVAEQLSNLAVWSPQGPPAHGLKNEVGISQKGQASREKAMGILPSEALAAVEAAPEPPPAGRDRNARDTTPTPPAAWREREPAGHKDSSLPNGGPKEKRSSGGASAYESADDSNGSYKPVKRERRVSGARLSAAAKLRADNSRIVGGRVGREASEQPNDSLPRHDGQARPQTAGGVGDAIDDHRKSVKSKFLFGCKKIKSRLKINADREISGKPVDHIPVESVLREQIALLMGLNGFTEAEIRLAMEISEQRGVSRPSSSGVRSQSTASHCDADGRAGAGLGMGPNAEPDATDVAPKPQEYARVNHAGMRRFSDDVIDTDVLYDTGALRNNFSTSQDSDDVRSSNSGKPLKSPIRQSELLKYGRVGQFNFENENSNIGLQRAQSGGVGGSDKGALRSEGRDTRGSQSAQSSPRRHSHLERRSYAGLGSAEARNGDDSISGFEDALRQRNMMRIHAERDRQRADGESKSGAQKAAEDVEKEYEQRAQRQEAARQRRAEQERHKREAAVARMNSGNSRDADREVDRLNRLDNGNADAEAKAAAPAMFSKRRRRTGSDGSTNGNGDHRRPSTGDAGRPRGLSSIDENDMTTTEREGKIAHILESLQWARAEGKTREEIDDLNRQLSGNTTYFHTNVVWENPFICYAYTLQG